MNICQQWRFKRENREIKWPWISFSRGRKVFSLLFLELLLLAVLRWVTVVIIMNVIFSHLNRFVYFCLLFIFLYSIEWLFCAAVNMNFPLGIHILSYPVFCFQTHLPGFVQQAEELKNKGVEELACISINDVFVMASWGKDQGADGKVGTSVFWRYAQWPHCHSVCRSCILSLVDCLHFDLFGLVATVLCRVWLTWAMEWHP